MECRTVDDRERCSKDAIMGDSTSEVSSSEHGSCATAIFLCKVAHLFEAVRRLFEKLGESRRSYVPGFSNMECRASDS